ncbi:MAG: hypothetical protein AAFZ52_11240 [Bacteroidota bacterium]
MVDAFLLPLHSVMRWLVLLSLLYAIFLALRGKVKQLAFTKNVNHVRHWTATIAHVQLLIGIILYPQSATVAQFFQNGERGWSEYAFFATVHITMMLAAIVIITIGSAKAKRKATDAEKYQTMLTFFTLGLILLLIAIPWPFSPLADRPYLRPF